MGRRICPEFPVDKYHDPPAKRRAAQFGSKLNIRSSSELGAEYLIRGVGRGAHDGNSPPRSPAAGASSGLSGLPNANALCHR